VAACSGNIWQQEPYDIDPGVCKDAHPSCVEWAKTGVLQQRRVHGELHTLPPIRVLHRMIVTGMSVLDWMGICMSIEPLLWCRLQVQDLLHARMMDGGAFTTELVFCFAADW